MASFSGPAGRLCCGYTVLSLSGLYGVLGMTMMPAEQTGAAALNRKCKVCDEEAHMSVDPTRVITIETPRPLVPGHAKTRVRVFAPFSSAFLSGPVSKQQQTAPLPPDNVHGLVSFSHLDAAGLTLLQHHKRSPVTDTELWDKISISAENGGGVESDADLFCFRSKDGDTYRLQGCARFPGVDVRFRNMAIGGGAHVLVSGAAAFALGGRVELASLRGAGAHQAALRGLGLTARISSLAAIALPVCLAWPHFTRILDRDPDNLTWADGSQKWPRRGLAVLAVQHAVMWSLGAFLFGVCGPMVASPGVAVIGPVLGLHLRRLARRA